MQVELLEDGKVVGHIEVASIEDVARLRKYIADETIGLKSKLLPYSPFRDLMDDKEAPLPNFAQPRERRFWVYKPRQPGKSVFEATLKRLRDLEEFERAVPSAEEFTEKLLRGIASQLGLSYEDLSKDYTRPVTGGLVTPAEKLRQAAKKPAGPTPLIIGLYSSAPQSGKSTAADYLVKHHGFKRLKFAGALKEMIRAMLRRAGYKKPEIEDLVEGSRKEEKLAIFGDKSVRDVARSLGTEWGRDMVSKDLWTEMEMSVAKRYGGRVVFDDMRFPNEFEAVKAAGGYCVRIVRDSAVDTSGHASEGALDGYAFDRVIDNNGDLYFLKSQLASFVRLPYAKTMSVNAPVNFESRETVKARIDEPAAQDANEPFDAKLVRDVPLGNYGTLKAGGTVKVWPNWASAEPGYIAIQSPFHLGVFQILPSWLKEPILAESVGGYCLANGTVIGVHQKSIGGFVLGAPDSVKGWVKGKAFGHHSKPLPQYDIVDRIGDLA